MTRRIRTDTSQADLADPGEPGYGERWRPRISVTQPEAQLLSILAANRSVLEIGTGLGVSTEALARLATSLLTLDIDPWVQQTVWPVLPKWVQTGVDIPPGVRYDLIFIDGNHQEEAVGVDQERAARVSHEGTLVLWHDIHYEQVAEKLLKRGVKVQALLRNLGLEVR